MNKLMRMIRYGTVAEQKFIDEFKNKFDVLIINANMISHASNAISKFIATRPENLNYVIDPLTHSLQHNIELLKDKNGNIKSSILKMIDSYTEFVKEKIFNEEVLVPADFEKIHNLRSFTESVLDFQENHVMNNAREKDYFKYLEFLGINFKPIWTVAPYFMMNSRTVNKWIDINIEMIKYAKMRGTNEIAAQIVIEKDVLEDKNQLEWIANQYIECDIKNFLVWVDDFSAFESSKLLLENFCFFVKKLNTYGARVYNLYGDYFSVLLCHKESPSQLSGVCHGIEYGEKRSVVPVGGGIPINKYYFYPLHQRIEYGSVATILRLHGIIPDNYEKYYEEICNCPLCQEVIGKDMDNFQKFGDSKPVEISRGFGKITRNFPTTEAKALCIRHFLYCKQREWDELSSIPLRKILDDLITASEKYMGVLGYDLLATFELWKNILLPKGVKNE